MYIFLVYILQTTRYCAILDAEKEITTTSIYRRFQTMILNGLQSSRCLIFPARSRVRYSSAAAVFRCPFCHNASLVLAPDEAEQISEETVLAFLKNARACSTVSASWWRTLLQPGLAAFLEKVRALGYAVKSTPTGTSPNACGRWCQPGFSTTLQWTSKTVQKNIRRPSACRRSTSLR